MANVSRKSILSYWVGLTRETTSLDGMRLFAKRGFVGPKIYLSATEGSEALVDLEGWTTVTTLTTSTTSASARGLGSVSSSSGIWTLAAPVPGVVKRLFATSTSTLLRQFTVASGNITAGIMVSTAYGTTAGSTYTTVNLNAQGQAVTLIGLSTAMYGVMTVNGFSTSATPFTTV